MIVRDNGWHSPSCLTCWPQVKIPKDWFNLPLSGVLVYL
jgi:hypothetical protein